MWKTTGNGKARDAAAKRGEGGFALVVVLFVMVVLSSVAVASLLTSGDERMAGRAGVAPVVYGASGLWAWPWAETPGASTSGQL